MTGSGILPHHAGHIEISLQTLRIYQGMKDLHHTWHQRKKNRIGLIQICAT